jgi:uncharacterized repeat protein (TIGR03837 family)
MHAISMHPLTLAIFCKVVDNFGDIGICWRLARQFHAEHGVAVTLWVDDLGSFQRIWPAVSLSADEQTVDGIQVRHWKSQDGDHAPADIPDVVIEFFGVDLPPGYIAAMAQCEPRPVWINYEGLSAEKWVEGCHRLPSMHPRLKLTKHFFFPGFNEKTGGLLRERGLIEERNRFQGDPDAMAAFLTRLGVPAAEMDALKISLFCYPDAPVAEMFEVWETSTQKVVCLVPEGVAREKVAAFLGGEAHSGAAATRGGLTVRVIPFMPACDVNFVRGEDSWVRAQWAARPFIWHIYPQDENLHHVKLRAFLQKYAMDGRRLVDFSLCWNGAGEGHVDWAVLWTSLQTDLPTITRRAQAWETQMLANGDLVSNLLNFVQSLR